MVQGCMSIISPSAAKAKRGRRDAPRALGMDRALLDNRRASMRVAYPDNILCEADAHRHRICGIMPVADTHPYSTNRTLLAGDRIRLTTRSSVPWGSGGMADAADLSSAGCQGRVGSTPIRPTLVYPAGHVSAWQTGVDGLVAVVAHV